jgi:threonine/homoserine/homoserine lactone efflux protein
MVAPAAGLAAVMNADPVLFRALQWFGAAYLCWMGVQLLRARAAGGSSSTTLIAMMVHVTVLSLLCQAGLVLVGNAAARRLKALPFARQAATLLARVALTGFGIKLAAGNR